MAIFLSHNSDDKPAVERLAIQLDDAGHSVWFDKWNLIPGEPWQEDLEKEIDKSECVIVFLGKNLGPWHNEEMRLALGGRVKGKKKVIPVLLPGVRKPDKENLPPFLSRLTWVEFSSIDDPYAFHLLDCGIKGIPPGRTKNP